MSAKVRRMIDSRSIYIKKIVTSEKIPTRVLAKSSAVRSVSRCRTWGTWSCKNLMNARLICRSVRSGPWAVKKAFAQSGVMYDEQNGCGDIKILIFSLEAKEGNFKGLL